MTLRNRFTRGLFRRRGFRGRRTPVKWTAVKAGPTAVSDAGGVLELPIVVQADYSDNAQLSPSGVTMVRLVGTITFAPNMSGGETQLGQFAAMIDFGIATIDQDEVATDGFNPASQSDLIAERWIWTAERLVWGYTEAVDHAGMSRSDFIEFDIRQRVRLRGSGVSLFVRLQNVLAGVDTPIWGCAIQARALLMGNTD